MAIEQKPAHPLDKATWLSKGPPGKNRFSRYRVRDGDYWGSVARRDMWSDPKGLVQFNFGTTKPEEVNWYLREFVGCNVSNDGGKNWSFSDSASPGHIYTQYDLSTMPPPPPGPGDLDPDAEYQGPEFDSGWWFGFGVKGGFTTPDLRHLGLPINGVGADLAVMQMVSLESLLEWKDGLLGGFGNWNRYVLNIDALRYDSKGPGGGGLGMVMGVVRGINHPSELRGYRVEGTDFNVAVGPLKSSLGKMAESIAPLFRTMGKNLLRALKNPFTWDSAASIAKTIQGELDLDASSKAGKTSIQVYDMPISIGAELDFYSYTGMTQILLPNYRSPRQRWEDRKYPDL